MQFVIDHDWLTLINTGLRLLEQLQRYWDKKRTPAPFSKKLPIPIRRCSKKRRTSRRHARCDYDFASGQMHSAMRWVAAWRTKCGRLQADRHRKSNLPFRTLLGSVP